MRFVLEEIINLVPLGIPNTRKNILFFTVNLLTSNTTKKNLDKKTSTVETRDCILRGTQRLFSVKYGEAHIA